MGVITEKDKVWTILDEVIEENRDKACEAIETMTGEHNHVRIKYARIKDNRLFEREFEVSMWLLNNLHEDTIRLILKELFVYFRKPAD